MPTYEYICKNCGHLFEIVQSMKDDPLTECPECGGTLRKVFAPPAISFKGSGFYATDHGKKGRSSSSDGGQTDGQKERAGGSKQESGSGTGDTSSSGTKAASSSGSSSSGSDSGPNPSSGPSKGSDTKSSGQGGTKGGAKEGD